MKPLYLDTGTRPRLNLPDVDWKWLPLIQIQTLSDLEWPQHYRGLILSSSQSLSIIPPDLLSKFDKIFAIGKSTASAAVNKGLKVDHVAGGDIAQLLQDLARMNYTQPILHPCSAQTRLDTQIARELGLEVLNLAVYRPVLHPQFTQEWIRISENPYLRGVFYFSGSAVQAALEVPDYDLKTQTLQHIACGSSAAEAMAQSMWKHQTILPGSGPDLDFFSPKESI